MINYRKKKQSDSTTYPIFNLVIAALINVAGAGGGSGGDDGLQVAVEAGTPRQALKFARSNQLP
jgi:hypothetical protein